MPIYEYRCPKCSYEFEYLVLDIKKINQYQTMRCEKCGAQAIRKFSIPSKPNFRGDGFFETDYKKKKV